MRIYISGKWADRDQVQNYMVRLAKAGHTITEDWTQHHHPPSFDEAQRYAMADILGIKNCDAIVVIFERNYRYRGSFIEIGAALALGKPVLILGDKELDSTLLNHFLVTRLASWDDLANTLYRMDMRRV